MWTSHPMLEDHLCSSQQETFACFVFFFNVFFLPGSLNVMIKHFSCNSNSKLSFFKCFKMLAQKLFTLFMGHFSETFS